MNITVCSNILLITRFRWRLMSAATRDHSLNEEMFSDNFTSGEQENNESISLYDESWHDELCAGFIREYKQYLLTLGFVPLEADGKKYLFIQLQLLHVPTITLSNL